MKLSIKLFLQPSVPKGSPVLLLCCTAGCSRLSQRQALLPPAPAKTVIDDWHANGKVVEELLQLVKLWECVEQSWIPLLCLADIWLIFMAHCGRQLTFKGFM